MADGIFGSSPADVQSALMQQALGNAQIFGALGAAGRGALTGTLLGGGISQHPRMRQAVELQRISKELAARGLTPGTKEYTAALVPQVQAKLGTQAAMEAQKMAIEAEKRQIEVAGLRSGNLGLARGLVGAVPDMDPAVAKALAATAPKVAAQMIQDAGRATPLVRNVRRINQLTPMSPEEEAELLKEAVTKPGQVINIQDEAAKVEARKRAALRVDKGEVLASTQDSLDRYRRTLDFGECRQCQPDRLH